MALAERTLEAMGGAAAWEATRFLRFNFFGFRLHYWDRYTGRHRVEGKTRDGVSYLVLHNIHSHAGQVFLNGELQSGEPAKEWLDRAYSMWINDTYWLIMPYKLRDPGVTLRYDGEEQIDGVTYDKLHLAFAGVGLTPGDQYWAYLNRETGLMDLWAYVLEDYKPDQPPTRWFWRDWQRHGQILLAARRINPDPANPRETELGNLGVFTHLPDEVFTAPSPVQLPN